VISTRAIGLAADATLAHERSKGASVFRRMLYAVILLAAAVLVVRVAVVARDFNTVLATAYFEAVRDRHTELRAFLYGMPKGGDLHTHLSGAVYAERFITWAAQQNMCADLTNVLLSKSQCDLPGDVPVANAMHDQLLYDRLVNAFSTRSFVPTTAIPTDQDKIAARLDGGDPHRLLHRNR
jgi:adenosine deaminase